MKNTTLLFAADDVDHNILTSDGKGIFHGMGMNNKVDIVEYQFAYHTHLNIKFRELQNHFNGNRSVDIL